MSLHILTRAFAAYILKELKFSNRLATYANLKHAYKFSYMWPAMQVLAEKSFG